MRPTGNHVQAAILRAIAAEAGLDGIDREKPMLIVENVASVDWASATFVGARHDIEIRFSGSQDDVEAAATRLEAGLPERDIPIAGQIVAEIGVTRVKEDKRNVNMTVLTLMVNALTIVD